MRKPPLVTIVICHRSGADDILKVCLSKVREYTKAVDYGLALVVRTPEEEESVFEIADMHYAEAKNPVDVYRVDCDDGPRVHGNMLDIVIPSEIDTTYVLTLDSDCFPVARKWLPELMDFLHQGAACSGILFPWAPPPADMPRNKIEWRVRWQHCWESTHVACQLMYTDDVKDMAGRGASFATGDDTGLAFSAMARNAGRKCLGYRPTRCPLPEGDIDPEFNRYVGVLYGDKVYHHGGFTRVASMGDDPVFDSSYRFLNRKIMDKGGAEWLLWDDNSYQYKFDREEEVAAEKMQRLFGLKSQRMKG